MARDFLTDINMGGGARVIGLLDPVNPQDAATKAYVDSAVEGIAWKSNVRVASTANINLSAPGATIDGITMVVNDRFLAKDQSTQTQNGIYVWNGAATPATRASDASTFEELEQAVITVEEGTSNSGTTWRQTQVNGAIGSSNVLFTAFGTSAGAATETAAGVAEIATQGETDTGTDDTRFVTPLKLANWSGRKRKGSAVIGDGSATTFNIDHNFNTRQVVVEVYRNNGNFDTVIADVTRPTVNRVAITFASAPALNAYEVVVLG